MKKNLLVILGLVLVFGAVSCNPAPPPPPKKSAPATTPAKPAPQPAKPATTPAKPAPAKPQPAKPAPAKPAPQPAAAKPAPQPAKPAPQGNWKPGQQTKPITDGVAETLDYGASVGRAYNNSKTKTQNINDQHNRELEDAMRE